MSKNDKKCTHKSEEKQVKIKTAVKNLHTRRVRCVHQWEKWDRWDQWDALYFFLRVVRTSGRTSNPYLVNWIYLLNIWCVVSSWSKFSQRDAIPCQMPNCQCLPLWPPNNSIKPVKFVIIMILLANCRLANLHNLHARCGVHSYTVVKGRTPVVGPVTMGIHISTEISKNNYPRHLKLWPCVRNT